MTEKRSPARRILSRRSVLEIGVPGACAFALGARNASAFADTSSTSGTSDILIHALRSIGTEKCLAAADDLEVAPDSGALFSLHLRSAGLKGADAGVLAEALERYSSENGRILQSFSVSYNPFLGDDGAATLARSLPRTIREFGFVGCDIGDIGGEALLEWARQASRLSMICVEDNAFSQSTRMRFRELAKERTGLLVVVWISSDLQLLQKRSFLQRGREDQTYAPGFRHSRRLFLWSQMRFTETFNHETRLKVLNRNFCTTPRGVVCSWRRVSKSVNPLPNRVDRLSTP